MVDPAHPSTPSKRQLRMPIGSQALYPAARTHSDLPLSRTGSGGMPGRKNQMAEPTYGLRATLAAHGTASQLLLCPVQDGGIVYRVDYQKRPSGRFRRRAGG